MIDVTLAGTGGMLPMKHRWLTSCYISCNGQSMLIDTGEGTQIALKYAECHLSHISVICITHFHADHISGLVGLLLSIGNEGRTQPVTIIGPKGLRRIVHSLCVIAPHLPFPIELEEIGGSSVYRCGKLQITPFRVQHGVPCYGYTIELPRAGKFYPEKAKANGVPLPVWSALQKQPEAVWEGKVYTQDMVLGPPRRGLKLTYCTDTRPCDSIVEAAENADLFICEGLYYEPDKLSRAKETHHMLFQEAAALAQKSGAKELWLTHFSPAVSAPEEGLPLAREIFPQTFCGTDGRKTTLYFPES